MLPQPENYPNWQQWARALMQSLTGIASSIGLEGASEGESVPPEALPSLPPGFAPVWLDQAAAELYLGNPDFSPPDAADIVFIDTQNLADLAVELSKMAAGSVGTLQLLDLAVIAAKIGDAQVLTAKIGDLQVVTAKIADGAVNNLKVADLAVTSAKIANAAIGSAHLQNAIINTAHINDLQVTGAKIADLAVNSLKVQELTLGDRKLAPGAANSVGAVDIDLAGYHNSGSGEFLNLPGVEVTVEAGFYDDQIAVITFSFSASRDGGDDDNIAIACIKDGFGSIGGFNNVVVPGGGTHLFSCTFIDTNLAAGATATYRIQYALVTDGTPFWWDATLVAVAYKKAS